MMRDYLIPALFVLLMTTALRAADDPGVEGGDEVAAPVRPGVVSSPLAPVPAYVDPADSQEAAVKPKKSGGPGYTQLGGQIILHLDREKTELTLYENSAYIIKTKREGVVSNNVSNRLLIEIEGATHNAIAFRTLKTGMMWLTFYAEEEKRYVVEITVKGDTRELTSQLKELYPDSKIQAIKVGQGVLLRGEVSKREHVAEVIEIAEQHYPKALNQLKAKVKPTNQAPPSASKSGPQTVRPLQSLPTPTVAVTRKRSESQIAIQAHILEIDWQILADKKVDLSQTINAFASNSEMRNVNERRSKKPTVLSVVVPQKTTDGIVRLLLATNAAKVISQPTIATTVGRPAKFDSGYKIPVVSSKTIRNGKQVLETSYRDIGTIVRVTTHQPLLGQVKLDVSVELGQQASGYGVKTGAGVISPEIRTIQFSAEARLKAGQAAILASVAPLANQSNTKGLLVILCPSLTRETSAVPLQPAKTGSLKTIRGDGVVHSNLSRPQLIRPRVSRAPVSQPQDLRQSVRQLRGDVRALRKDVKKLLNLLEKQTSAVPTVAPTVGAVERRINESKTDLLVFEAPWCGPCQKMAPLLEEQAARGFSIRRLDVDRFSELAKEFRVSAVPTIIAFSNGKEEERWKGMIGADELTRIVEKYAPRKSPVTWNDLRTSRVTTTERATLKALDGEVSLEFKETPLEDAVREIWKTSQLNIILDRRGLEEEGVTPKTPVTVSARDLNLSSALNLMLEPLNLAQQVRDEVVVVTSRQRSRGAMTVVTYPVADLVIPLPTAGSIPAKKPSDDERADQTNRPSVQSPAVEFDKLTATIQSTVQPDSWDVVGGPASIQPFETTLSLVIRQTAQAHEEIADLIQQLRRLQDMQVRLESHDLDKVPDQLWEKIRRRLNVKDGSGIAGGVAVLTRDEARLVLEAVQGDDRPNVGKRPNITLFNGQKVGIAHPIADGPPREYELLHFQPVISADRRNVRLSVWVRDRVSQDSLLPAEGDTRALVRTVPAGKTLLIEVTEKEGNAVGVPIEPGKRIFKNTAGKPRIGRRFLLIRPKIIVQEDEEELLGIPAKK